MFSSHLKICYANVLKLNIKLHNSYKYVLHFTFRMNKKIELTFLNFQMHFIIIKTYTFYKFSHAETILIQEAKRDRIFCSRKSLLTARRSSLRPYVFSISNKYDPEVTLTLDSSVKIQISISVISHFLSPKKSFEK